MMTGDSSDKDLLTKCHLGEYPAKGCIFYVPGIVLGIVDTAIRHSLFRELTFSWEAKDKQMHDCHKEKVRKQKRQNKEVESDGSEERTGAVLDKVLRESILRCNLSRDLKEVKVIYMQLPGKIVYLAE